MVIKPLNVLGLMCGTAIEGVKAALVTTDGVDLYSSAPEHQFLFPEDLRTKIHSVSGFKINDPAQKAEIETVESAVTDFLIETVRDFARESDAEINLLGLEGPTICHEPAAHYTYQLGKGRLIAAATGLKTVTHFHNADILNGGQGAPITPMYYNALAQDLGKPVAFINIGGITSVSWIGPYGEICAFDCGPGNALIDQWMLKHSGMLMDYNGKMAALGQVHEKIVAHMMKHDFFAKYPPKSADRNDFNDKSEHLEGLTVEDGAATATALIAEAIAYSLALYVPQVPVLAVICGDGSHNPTLVRFIRQRLKEMEIRTVLENEVDLTISDAQAIAFLAARRLYGLPLTFPTTTGVAVPMTGGEIYEKEEV